MAKTRKVRGYLRGLSVLTAFLCAVMFGAFMIGSGDYKSMIDQALGVSGAAGSMAAEDYAFQSDYDSTTEMMTARRAVATELEAEGAVLIKNNETGEGKTSLPLFDYGETGSANVTLLGTRAYTYDASGNRRDYPEGGNGQSSVYGGLTGSIVRPSTVTTTDGVVDVPVTLEEALAENGININPDAKRAYDGKPFGSFPGGSEGNGSSGSPFNPNEPSITKNECGNYSAYSDAAIVFLGRASGEGRDYLPGTYGMSGTGGNTSALGLYDSELALIDVASEISDNVIVLLCSAVAMDIDSLKNDDRVDSVLWIGLPGAYGMEAVADIIAGKISPSGKLPDTYAVNASYSPAAQNFGTHSPDGTAIAYSNKSSYGNVAWRANSEHYTVFAEGLYVGYRYYETRYYDTVYGNGNASAQTGSSTGNAWKYEDEVAYSFGYGMSYVDFDESIVPGSLKVDLEARTVSVDVSVTNNGSMPAKYVAQLYVQSPYTDYDKDIVQINGTSQRRVEKSAVQLLSFEKKEIAAGATETITVTGDLKYVASYDKTAVHTDENGEQLTGGYILEAGDYYFAIGNGAHAALNNIIALQGGSFYAEEWETPDASSAVSCDLSGYEGWSDDGNGVSTSLIAQTSEDGEYVHNRMENADYNYYKSGTVTYLSRSDWSGTFPRTYTSLEVTDGMVNSLNNHEYDFKSGAVTTTFGYDHSEDIDEETGEPMENLSVADLKLAAFDDERWDYLLDQVTFYEAWFLSPYGGTENEAIVSVNAPTAWQIDGPNGNVTSTLRSNRSKTSGLYAISADDPNANVYTCDMPCEPIIAATFSKELARREGDMFGEEMIWSGNAMQWAPGMNLHRTPFNSRNHEYYSEDSMLTNLIGRSVIEGGLEKGAILAPKHFAFNSQESFREGLGQFMEEQSARELELRGFEGALSDAKVTREDGTTVGALGAMTTFSRIGVVGGNGHTGVMKGILRGEWGFKGLSSSDMVVTGEFFTIQDAAINNVTFMASTGPESLLSQYWTDWNDQNKVRSDPDMCEALRDNMHYYLYALANSSALNGISPDFVVTNSMSWWQVALIAIGAALAAIAAALAALYVISVVRARKSASVTRTGGEA